MGKFNRKDFITDNKITVIELDESDFLYIQIPKVESDSEKDRRKRISLASACFDHFLPRTNFLVDDVPLKFTVITKKEEFVARLNNNIVQL